MITTKTEIRKLFWAQHPTLSREKIRSYDGYGTMYTTDTRCAFVDFVDWLRRDGRITAALADRATLERAKRNKP